MEPEIIVGILTFISTVTGAWLLHRREVSKQKTASEVTVATIYSQIRTDYEKHSEFMRSILVQERADHQIERERSRMALKQLDECLARNRKRDN